MGVKFRGWGEGVALEFFIFLIHYRGCRCRVLFRGKIRSRNMQSEVTLLVIKLVSTFAHETREIAHETSFYECSRNDFSRNEFFFCSRNECSRNEFFFLLTKRVLTKRVFFKFHETSFHETSFFVCSRNECSRNEFEIVRISGS